MDDAVVGLFLGAVQPAGVELGLAGAREAEHQAAGLDRTWTFRIEPLEYDARVAERRYMAVDAGNRVVARGLERDRERRLRALEAAKREHAAVREREHLEFTA